MSKAEGEEPIPMTAGERLRAAREAAEMSLEDVATTTRIPTRHLAFGRKRVGRIPANRAIGFPKAPTVARSFAKSVDDPGVFAPRRGLHVGDYLLI